MLDVNNKVKRELAQIQGLSPDHMSTLQLSSTWLAASEKRIHYLDGLRKRGITGSNYSNAVIDFDKTGRIPLWES